MQKTPFFETHLIGLALKGKTTNKNGQSSIDCGKLWQQFEAENIAGKIPDKLSDEIFAVYHNYEGDFTQPFSYFIGCKVAPNTKIPEGLNDLTISKGIFSKRTAKGKMPDCVADTWKEIWNSGLQRAYQRDFEIYDERSKDWNDAEVDIYVSVK
ncbi:MAG TPA: GyrI-like domain-containing protein [Balneolaceae bacterium]|nr:GyrI-like domain-containing protein [Balneolaceae bacterium]